MNGLQWNDVTMKRVLNRYKALRSDRSFYFQFLVGILFLLISVVLNFVTNSYTALHASSAVSDLFLDNLPIVNVEEIFLEGMMILIAFVVFLGFSHPKRIPFILKSSALFIATRSFFMILTHLAPPVGDALFLSGNVVQRFMSGADLFFSGHTGYPFLMALIFWEQRSLRIFFIAASLFFGAAVLLGHIHYSIDVFSAFFITYGIFKLATVFFKRDHGLFMKDSS